MIDTVGRLWTRYRTLPVWAQAVIAALVLLVVIGVAVRGNKENLGLTTPSIAATSSASTPNRLTGIGATRVSFTHAHGLSLSGCPARTCFGPKVATGSDNLTYQFELVRFGNGNVIGYTEAFASGTSLPRAERETLAAFPKDTSTVRSGLVRDDTNGQSCRWVDVSSKTLGKVFGDRLANRLFIEFATEDSSGKWTYDPGDINQALVSPGWYTPGNPC